MAGKKVGPGQIVVEIKPGEEFRSIINDYFSALDAKSRKGIIRLATLVAQDAVKTWYSDVGRDHWTNKSLPTHGPGRKPTQWWRGTTDWKAQEMTSRSSVLMNRWPGLAHKVTGGTIRPVRAKRLAIPLVPAAHGLSPRTYGKTIAPLFPMGNSLAPRGGKPAYALAREVTHRPWPDALPPEKVYMLPYSEEIVDRTIKHLEGII